ncbi:MAG TPA: hypothetical protein VNL35_21950 [Chloroflexota bacterium]|nr:hypothetical protein [Chloroflexota bacterium]
MAQHESFLVRVWWRARQGEGQWVGRLEHLRQRKIQHFHDPEALLAHLRTVIMPEEIGTPEADPKGGPLIEGKESSKEPTGDDSVDEITIPRVGGTGESRGLSLGLHPR